MIRVGTKLSRARWGGRSCWMQRIGARRSMRCWTKAQAAKTTQMPIAQVDREPLSPQFGLSQWRPGLLLADPYQMSLPKDLKPGRYRLVFGWYRGNERLKWANGQDTQPLAEIEVVGP